MFLRSIGSTADVRTQGDVCSTFARAPTKLMMQEEETRDNVRNRKLNRLLDMYQNVTKFKGRVST